MVVGVEMGDDEIVVSTLIHHMHPPLTVLTYAQKGVSSNVAMSGRCSYSFQHAVMDYCMLERL